MSGTCCCCKSNRFRVTAPSPSPASQICDSTPLLLFVPFYLEGCVICNRTLRRENKRNVCLCVYALCVRMLCAHQHICLIITLSITALQSNNRNETWIILFATNRFTRELFPCITFFTSYKSDISEERYYCSDIQCNTNECK